MKKIIAMAMFLSVFSVHAGASNKDDACKGKESCFMALNGLDEQLCEAYMESRSCFMALNGDDVGWCDVLRDKKSCFMSLNGQAEKDCEDSNFPGNHLYWKNCRDNHNGGGCFTGAN